MKDSTRKALNDAIRKNAEHEEQKAQERTAEQEAQRQFIADFDQLQNEMIEPTLREIGEHLAEHGHKFEITRSASTYIDRSDKPDPAISIAVFPQGIPRDRYGSELPPGVTFTASRLMKKVKVHARNMVPGSGGQAGPAGEYSLDQIDSDLIEDIATKNVKEILANGAGARRYQ